MNKILTIVIPTYNMEKYLSNCLNSFIFNENEQCLEVLIVNDGSKDNSLSIARQYEEKYPNIFKVIDKENGGHGSTVNAGLKVAQGKYFKVVDSDDWVDTQQLSELVDFLKNTDVDLVINSYYQVIEGTSKKIICGLYDLNESETYEVNSGLMANKVAMAATTVKTELIKGFEITEKCFYVDVEYMLYCLFNAKNFVYFNKPIYQYRIGRVGQSVSVQGFLKHREDHLKVVKKLVTTVKDNDSQIVQDFVSLCVKNHYLNYVKLCKLEKNAVNELKEFDVWLKDYEIIYNNTNNCRRIKSLRHKDFKNFKFHYCLYQIKHFVKKMLRRC